MSIISKPKDAPKLEPEYLGLRKGHLRRRKNDHDSNRKPSDGKSFIEKAIRSDPSALTKREEGDNESAIGLSSLPSSHRQIFVRSKQKSSICDKYRHRLAYSFHQGSVANRHADARFLAFISVLPQSCATKSSEGAIGS
eukprot:scaffold112137_cov53-Cyclotella_meneghiniana.AAC.1